MIRGLHFALVLAMVAAAKATSQESKPINPKRPQVRVEIQTDKRDYAEGEPIKFKVTLVNQGILSVYIAKSWSYAGGGIAGFFISIKQLSGKPPQAGCSGAADRGVLPDSRSPERILREDFVLLPRGGFVGLEDQYRECAVEHAGLYQISAIYSPNDLNTHNVASLADDKSFVLTERTYSEPFTFRVHPAKAAGSSPKPGS